MQSSSIFSPLFLCARFQHENVKLFGNILPRRAFTERSHIELSSARMFDAASLVEHMPHCVLGRLCLCGGLFHRVVATRRKGRSGTAAVQPSVSIVACMIWPKAQGKQKKIKNKKPHTTTNDAVQHRSNKSSVPLMLYTGNDTVGEMCGSKGSKRNA